jgi:hypothetical protein
MERCFAAQATISTSLIAVMPEAGYEIRKVHPRGVASAPTSGFVPELSAPRQRRHPSATAGEAASHREPVATSPERSGLRATLMMALSVSFSRNYIAGLPASWALALKQALSARPALRSAETIRQSR